MPTKSKNVKYTGIPSENGTFSTFYTLKNRKTIAFKDLRISVQRGMLILCSKKWQKMI